MTITLWVEDWAGWIFLSQTRDKNVLWSMSIDVSSLPWLQSPNTKEADKLHWPRNQPTCSPQYQSPNLHGHMTRSDQAKKHLVRVKLDYTDSRISRCLHAVQYHGAWNVFSISIHCFRDGYRNRYWILSLCLISCSVNAGFLPATLA